MLRIVWEATLTPNRTIGSLEPGLNQLSAPNDHYTLAQLRPGLAMVSRPSYQSSRNVAFVQQSQRGLAGVVQVALQQVLEWSSCEPAAVSFAGRIGRRMLDRTAGKGWQE
jgi:hypothetical protein